MAVYSLFVCYTDFKCSQFIPIQNVHNGYYVNIFTQAHIYHIYILHLAKYPNHENYITFLSKTEKEKEKKQPAKQKLLAFKTKQNYVMLIKELYFVIYLYMQLQFSVFHISGIMEQNATQF